MNKIKTTLLINSSFFPNTGGVETTLLGMARDMTDNGENVVVVTGNKTAENLKIDKYSIELQNINIFRYNNFGFFSYYVTCILLLLNLKKKYTFEKVISRSIPTTICCLIAGVKNVKYIAPGVHKFQNHPSFLTNAGLKKRIGYILNTLIENICFKWLREIYVFSNEMETQIRKINKNIKIIKVFPGVDKRRFRMISKEEIEKLKQKYNLPENKKILLFLGRIEKVKNPKNAIDLLEFMNDDYILLMVGEGSFKEELKQYVSIKGLNSRVYFFDFTQKPEDFYNISDVFLMLSVYEPFGQVTLESLSTNTPVFGYKSSSDINTATSEIFTNLKIDENKYLTDYSENTKDLTDCITFYFDKKETTKKNYNINTWYEFIKNLA